MNHVYDIVTEKILDALEEGVVPWRQPWRAGGHCNLRSRRPYRGVNTLLLELVRLRRGFASEWWVSYRQAQTLGGQVRAGEKATMVVLWRPTRYTARFQDAETGADVEEEREGIVLRYYNVFNADQCDGLQLPAEETGVGEPVEAAERIVRAYPLPPTIHSGGGRAYYVHAADRVNVPAIARFATRPEHYATLFHELAHSTGHPSRLGRPGIVNFDHFGSERYSQEELVAEIGSAMLLSHAGLQPDYGQTAAYVGGWLKALRDDRKLVVVAAAQAQRAVDWILGIQADTAPPVVSPVDVEPTTVR